jgi:hypothetical protein
MRTSSMVGLDVRGNKTRSMTTKGKESAKERRRARDEGRVAGPF